MALVQSQQITGNGLRRLLLRPLLHLGQECDIGRSAGPSFRRYAATSPLIHLGCPVMTVRMMRAVSSSLFPEEIIML